jgi:hypothetical protein
LAELKGRYIQLYITIGGGTPWFQNRQSALLRDGCNSDDSRLESVAAPSRGQRCGYDGWT